MEKGPVTKTLYSLLQLFSYMYYRKNILTIVSIIAILAVDAGVRIYIGLSNDISGDTAGYAKIAKDIAATGSLQPFISNYYVEADSKRFVAYPQLFFVILAFAYIIGGEIGMQLITIAFGTATVLAAFLLTRSLAGLKAAIFSAVLVSVTPALMFTTSLPYMESAMLFFMVIGALGYLNFLKAKQNCYIVLAAIGMGLAMATKQQGLFLSLPLLVHAISLAAYPFVINSLGRRVSRESNDAVKKEPMHLKSSLAPLVIVALAFVIASPFLGYQIYTTGTIDNPPVSEITKSIFMPKWQENEESIEWLDNLRTVAFETTPLDALEYMFYKDPGAHHIESAFWVIVAILVIAGLTLIYKFERLSLFSAVAVLLVSNLVFMVYFDTPFRYSIFLPVFAACIAGYGASKLLYILHTRVSPFLKNDYKKLSVSLALGSLIVAPFGIFVAQTEATNIDRNYNISDRTLAGNWENRMDRYKWAAEWVNQNLDDNQMIMVDRWPEVVYYTDKRVFSGIPDELGASRAPDIYSSKIFKDAAPAIEEYGLTHIWISNIQIGSGFYERIPSNGLTQYMELSPYLSKTYENDLIRIYEIQQCDCNDFHIDKIDYLANFFDSDVDFSTRSAIYLEPASRWSMNSSGVRLASEDPGYIHFIVDKNDLNAQAYQPFTLFFAYKGPDNADFAIRGVEDESWLPLDSFAHDIYKKDDLRVYSARIDGQYGHSKYFSQNDLAVRMNAVDASLMAALLVPHDLDSNQIDLMSNDVMRLVGSKLKELGE